MPNRIISEYTVTKFVPFNPVDKKTVAHVTLPNGTQILTTKGAPQVIRDLLSDAAAREACDAYIAERASRGLRALGVAKSSNAEEGWTLTGLISLLDPPRTDSATTVRAAQDMGVEVKMVTGDQLAIAIETSRRLGLGTDMMEGKELMGDRELGGDLIARVDEVDGFAGVYPEHKHRIVEALQRKGRLVGMTGDGVNDAPALKKANVGIAVAGATAAAKGAADIILTEEGISTIITAIRRSRMIFRRLETYIIYRMASSILILGFFFFAVVIMTFEMPTWTLVLISLFNDLSVMATSLDKVHSSDKPMVWNMSKDLLVALGIASVGILGSVLLLYFASLDELNWWPADYQLERTGQPGITPGQVVAVMFLALVALIQLNILLTRNPTFFWRFGRTSAPRPSVILLLPMCAFLLAATFIAVYWPADVAPDGGIGNMEGAGWVPILITWAYVIAWWLLADLVKVAIQRVFARYDVIVARCKETGKRHPTWVRALDAPAGWVNRVGEWLPSPSLAFARTLDARVPGSKALLNSRALVKLRRRARAPGAASSAPPGSNVPSAEPPGTLSPTVSLVEAVSAASAFPAEKMSARSGRLSAATGLPTRATGHRLSFGKAAAATALPTRAAGSGLTLGKASAASVSRDGRGAPAGAGAEIEIVVDRRE
ncbi:h+ ATPase [Klebsormidium nitens]|uniref:H+ ATPase n=1 Tax=Klebsormidium nitens TaxID=105231 RepID=A0A1Y1I6N3_KLENI|nr:h+ ATPase [Klebsormidium nitens]|eukprot:GAQ86610.1 h+ ATPase [Klebsormidium nitens]